MTDYQVTLSVKKTECMHFLVLWELYLAKELLILVPNLDEARCVDRGKAPTA